MMIIKQNFCKLNFLQMIKVRVKSFECATPCLIIDHLIQHTWSVVVKVEPLEILSRPRPLLYLHLVSKYKQCCQLVAYFHSTVLKFPDFSIAQILFVNNFGESRIAKSALFKTFRDSEFCFSWIFAHFEDWKKVYT